MSTSTSMDFPSSMEGTTSITIPYHTFLGLITAFGGTTRIGLHACMLKLPLIILSLFLQNHFQRLSKTFCFVSWRFKALFPVAQSVICRLPTLLRSVERFVHVSANLPPREVVNNVGSREAGFLHFSTAHCTVKRIIVILLYSIKTFANHSSSACICTQPFIPSWNKCLS